MEKDLFGNSIDSCVGYARGSILKSSLEESLRHLQGLHLIRQRILRNGRDSLFNFTGHRRGFNISNQDLIEGLAEEYVGMSVVQDKLTIAGRTHFGAGPDTDVALFSRASAGIVSAMLALIPRGGKAIAVAPRCRTHPSVRRGIELVGAVLQEVDSKTPLKQRQLGGMSLVVVTRITAELDTMSKDELENVITAARIANCPIFIDDAYGARIAPIFLKQPKMLELSVDIGITSCDKAGLGGPRTGLMAGKSALVQNVVARGSELGFEARAPLLLGVLHSLEQFNPRVLIDDSQVGEKLTRLLKDNFRNVNTLDTFLGPTIGEEEILSLIVGKTPSLFQPKVVPAEAAGALAMILLEDHGILTSAALERPGSRVSLRLRPNSSEVNRFGGLKKFVNAIHEAFLRLRDIIDEPDEVAKILLGQFSQPG